jgi:hypothetical protein
VHQYIAVLLVMLFLSALGGWFICARKAVEKPVKIMLFVLYFWGLAFLQMALFALFYFVSGKLDW